MHFFLQKEQENVKSIRDEEEKLMVNAWYNLVCNSLVSCFTFIHCQLWDTYHLDQILNISIRFRYFLTAGDM